MGLPQVTENLEQRELFEEYVAMGKERRLEKLLAYTTRSWHTVQKWSVKFNWVKRAQERDKELMENSLVESPRENQERKKLALDIVNKMIRDIAVFDENGVLVDTKIKTKTVYDLRILVDVRDEILGLKEKALGGKDKGGTTNIDKAVFIIKK